MSKGIIGLNGPIGLSGQPGPSGILMERIEVVFIGGVTDSGRFLSLTKGNRYFVDATHNFGAENNGFSTAMQSFRYTTHVTLVDDLGKFITIRIGNFVSISGWRDIQINKLLCS